MQWSVLLLVIHKFGSVSVRKSGETISVLLLEDVLVSCVFPWRVCEASVVLSFLQCGCVVREMERLFWYDIKEYVLLSWVWRMFQWSLDNKCSLRFYLAC